MWEKVMLGAGEAEAKEARRPGRAPHVVINYVDHETPAAQISDASSSITYDQQASCASKVRFETSPL